MELSYAIPLTLVSGAFAMAKVIPSSEFLVLMSLCGTYFICDVLIDWEKEIAVSTGSTKEGEET